MKAPDRVHTERLLLTRPTLDDAAAVFARYASDPEVTRFLGWPRHTSVQDTEAFLALSDAEWEQWPAGPYLIRRRGDAFLLGSTGLSFKDRDHAVTGYVLAKDAWGQGFATEALVAMVRLARDLGVLSLEAVCHREHEASWRVLEKCGFIREPDVETTFPNLAGRRHPARQYRLRFDVPREMRQVEYLRHEGRDHAEARRAPLLTFLYDIPYLPACGILPPRHLLNAVLSGGGSPGGLGPSASWTPFTISATEYADLVDTMEHTPVSAIAADARYAQVRLQRDPEFDHLRDLVAWIRAVAGKHLERWRQLIRESH